MNRQRVPRPAWFVGCLLAVFLTGPVRVKAGDAIPASQLSVRERERISWELAEELGIREANVLEIISVRYHEEKGPNGTRTIRTTTYLEKKSIVSRRRLEKLGLTSLLDLARDAKGDREALDKALSKWPLMTTPMLCGMAAVERAYANGKEGAKDFEDVLLLPDTYRMSQFDLIGRIEKDATLGRGLDRAVTRGLPGERKGRDRRGAEPKEHLGVQGLLGQMHAAAMLAREFSGSPRPQMEFEVATIGRLGPREIDIVLTVGRRRIDVEVKTDLGKTPSMKDEQIKKDLDRHVGDDWKNLLYLYAPQQQKNLDQVKDCFRKCLKDLFDDPGFMKRLAANPAYSGLTGDEARKKALATLNERLEKGLVRCFQYR
jgi:hypothetical protein